MERADHRSHDLGYESCIFNCVSDGRIRSASSFNWHASVNWYSLLEEDSVTPGRDGHSPPPGIAGRVHDGPWHTQSFSPVTFESRSLINDSPTSDSDTADPRTVMFALVSIVIPFTSHLVDSPGFSVWRDKCITSHCKLDF